MRDAGAETKVNKLDYSLSLVQKDVLQLDISVGHIALVAVVDTLDHLTPQKFGLEFGHLSVRLHLEVAMKRASVDVLHEEEDLLVRLEGLIKLTNIRVV